MTCQIKRQQEFLRRYRNATYKCGYKIVRNVYFQDFRLINAEFICCGMVIIN